MSRQISAASETASAATSASAEPSAATAGLPVYKVRKKFLKLFKAHDVLVICGATGSGKSTQLPKFLHAAKLLGAHGKMVGITQPRRVAAVTVAKRVASELNSGIGRTVGYAVRFDNCTTAATRIKYVCQHQEQHASFAAA